MDFRTSFAIALLSLTVGACSGGGGEPPVTSTIPANQPPPTLSTLPDVMGEFSYEYNQQGCSTGKQTFTSKKEYCNAHLDDALNKNCARDLRLAGYSRMCTGERIVSPGVLPASGSARCVVNGMDLKDRTFLDNINPFNPQRTQNFRDIFWSGKREQAFDILFSAANSYGRASFVMTPEASGAASLGQIQLQQRKGEDSFGASSGLGSKLSLIVTNYKMEKEVEAACVSHASFKKPKGDLRQVRCTFRLGLLGEDVSSRDEVISWDLRTGVQKELHHSRDGEAVNVKLTPATAGQDEKIEIEVLELDLDKALKAQSTLNEGLKVVYRGRQGGTDLSVDCATASK